MGDLTPALVAIASIVGGLVALSRNLPRIRRLFRVDQAELVANLRELADTWEEKFNLVSADLIAAKAELASERQARRLCQGDLDDLRSVMRQRKRPGGTRGQGPL